MINNLEEFLIKEGYTRYSYNYNSDSYKEDSISPYSSMVNLSFFYIKDNNMIEIGLNEYNKPLTLIYPRPKIHVVFNDDITLINGECQIDEWVNYMLEIEDVKDIYKAIYDDSIVFRYTCNKTYTEYITNKNK